METQYTKAIGAIRKSQTFVRSLWRAGPEKRYSSLNLPEPLAKEYGLAKPCKVTVTGMPDLNGIFIQFYEDESENNLTNKVQE